SVGCRPAGSSGVGTGADQLWSARVSPATAATERARPARKPSGSPTVSIVLARRAVAEFIGTARLLIAGVGSGIAAAALSPGETGLELLENAAATGAALVAIILAVGSVSGAHLNPIVSGADAYFGGLRRREFLVYLVAQVLGAVVGVVLANLMFSLPAI